jgi:predicted lipase
MFSDYLEGTQGFAGYNPSRNEIVVSFRGSQNLANWYDNIDYFQKQYPGGPAGANIHIGFYDSYMTMSSQVLSAVSKLTQQHPTATIILTGHSLGAAQSTFAAMDIKLNLKPSNPMKVYNYGSPRTGNQAFTDFVYNYFPDGTFWRVVHKADPVPHLPLTGMGFNHAGNEAFYNDDSHPLSYQLCKSQQGHPENENCADIYYVYTINDHLNYLGFAINNECTSSSVVFPSAFLA